MAEVEVDVQLFIICRMCLEEPGVYQIIPSLRKLIKFCFEIDIEPYDGLPQLICKKCKSTLSDYHDTKRKFLEKQVQLNEKLKNTSKRGPTPEINSCDPNNEDKNPFGSPGISPVNAAPECDARQVNDDWKKAYDEHFMCKICNRSYLRASSVKRHVKNHKTILNEHKKIFRKYCVVQLNKIDEMPNSTGCSNVVVYDKDKILLDKGNSYYHSFYLKRDVGDYESGENKKKSAKVKRRAVFSDSSEDEVYKGKKKRKSRRLFSNSSTKTTILEDCKADCDISNNVVEPNTLNNHNGTDLVVHADRIDVDDAPSEHQTKNKLQADTSIVPRNPEKATIANYKAIQSIVTMCHKKYMKKVPSSGTFNKPSICDSIKHKILSLGRKVINKQGVGCTGLLRYMEHKNLEIKWQPVGYANQNKGSNFVRIMPKMKLGVDSDDDIGWKNLHEILFLNEKVHTENVAENNNSNKVEAQTIKLNKEDTPSYASDATKEDQSDKVFSTSSANDLYNAKKLLNESPVSNPRQLPKKIGAAETKPASNESTASHPFEDDEIKNTGVNNFKEDDSFQEDNNFALPIITSTQSLSNNNDNASEEDKVVDKPAPRIKVKPYSELMSEKIFGTQINHTPDDIWVHKQSYSLPLSNSSTVYVQSPMSQLEALVDTPSRNIESSLDKTNLMVPNENNLDFVILNTLELPNTKTKSPFQYFKTILLYHGLILLELNEELPAHFNCLVKFRLLLKQGTKQPLGVLLSLFCSNNNFCFNFKDSKSKKFDPNQLPAFWQWELLKVYKGDVVNKILQNAMKISKEVHENTKNFLCLLKSIDLIT